MRSIHHIEAPVEKVFDFFLDPRKSADLDPFATKYDDVRLTEDGTGSFYSWHGRMAGIPIEGFEVYTDVQPNKHIAERSSSALVGLWDYTFEPEGTGTKVVMEHHSRSFWGLPPLRMLNDMAVSRMSEVFMQRVKERLESSSS